MGKRQRWGAKRLRVAGKRARHERCCCPTRECAYCYNDAGDALETPPLHLDLLIADLELTSDCMDCNGPGLGAGSAKLIGGPIDGTYRLTYAASWSPDVCLWQLQTDLVVRHWPSSSDCTGDSYDRAIVIRLWKDTWYWRMDIKADLNVVYGVAAAYLFSDVGGRLGDPIWTCNGGTTFPTMLNAYAAWDCTFILGRNGTAEISVPA